MSLSTSYRPLLLLSICMVCSCSTQKNTWISRTHHIINTKYNVYYNGYESYKKGLQNIADANNDDFSKVLPMYPISNHENASAGTGDMDKAIEKCRKSIKLHSIKKKPQRNYRKAQDPKYQAWYNQEEFNTALADAWLLLAKSEFHKGDFLGSIGTFLYIAKHYYYDKDVVAQCQLWIARAYAETGWIYEAEEVLLNIKQDELKQENAYLYAAVHADLLLKKKQYKEAIPFLQIALESEKKKEEKTRLRFILGQLYQLTGNTRAAEEAYTKVIKANPAFDMDFNARINQAEMSTNHAATLKSLAKMAKKYKYKDNLEQIYGAIGNIYMAQKDTVKAMENYVTATEKSTQNGIEKAVVLIQLGDLYYDKNDYVKAQPCYEEASQIISSDNDDYARISQRAQTLGELIVEYNVVVLQDSLQRLSKMTPEEQMAVAEKIIADLEAAEKAAEEAARLQEEEGLTSVNTANMIGGGNMGPADWYFYNANLMKNGKMEFTRKWGQRKLEDNWRRASKSVTTLFADDTGIGSGTTEGNDSIAGNDAISDTKKPEFYLNQIPKTEEQLKLSDELIATALFNMGFIYKDRVEDINMSLKTFDEFEKRFPDDSRMPDVYYTRYLIFLQQDNKEEAETRRMALLTKFPESKYAQMLADPNYAERMQKMNAEQDSLYVATYQAYSQSRYQTVFENTQYAEKNFPLSPLMPKFLFLNALATAKTQNPQAFGDALRDMISRFPDSDVSAMAKDMLALMNQGLESQTGESHGTLLTRRETEFADTETNDGINKEFTTENNMQHVVLILIPESTENLNRLLYNIALFNFSQFLIKDFDLTAIATFVDNTSALKITYMDSEKETQWYINMLRNNTEINLLLHELEAKTIGIGEENLNLVTSGLKTLDEYELWKASGAGQNPETEH